MRILLTGAHGFLGWHIRLRLHALTDHEVLPVGRDEWVRLDELLARCDAVVHIAGVNRADTDDEVEWGNATLARDLASAVAAAKRPLRVVFANSIQSGNVTAYGRGKQRAAEILRESVDGSGGHLVDVLLPNIFGEHGRPHYNSFVATFVDATMRGQSPTIHDRRVGLLHVQDAAQALIDGLSTNATTFSPAPEEHSVQEVWDLLQEFHTSYVPSGEIPNLSTKLRIDLFNTYRAALFPEQYPIRLSPHRDHRGSFVETIRCRGGQGQTSVSTTFPGITRGEHYHLHKVERFAVISGSGTIKLRKMFTDKVLTFEVTGEQPVAIDMPVGWVHNITNAGDDILLTQFWSHELFRPEAPDTFPEPVRPTPVKEA
ncbi:polysaccharide biosynthesis C-terminal domain-containing protein [Nostocoides australiense]